MAIKIRKSPKASASKSAKPAKEGKRPMGKTSGVNLRETWILALQNKGKLTDEQISKFMQKEFPTNKSNEVQSVSGVQAVRRQYNAGKLTDGKVPSPQAKKYDAEGNVVEAVRGRPAGKESGRKPASKSGKGAGRKSKPKTAKA